MLTLKLLLAVYLALATTSAATLIPSRASDPTQERPSRVNPHELAKRSVIPIDPQKYPDWAGDFDPNDCKVALALMYSRFDFDLKTPFEFWSRRWVRAPRGNEWELPFGAVHGTVIPIYIATAAFSKLIVIQIPALLCSVWERTSVTMYCQ